MLSPTMISSVAAKAWMETELTPSELKSRRKALGLSAEGLARFLRLKAGRTVRRWEDGSQDIPAAAEMLLDVIVQFPDVREYFAAQLKAAADPAHLVTSQLT